jgi:hypothetical protein
MIAGPEFTQHQQVMSKKTVAFHFEFGAEIIENSRYEMQTLYSMQHLEIANEVLGRSE